MSLNDIAVQIWLMCADYQTHLSAAHIPGKHNILAYIASWEFHDAAEWMLEPRIFDSIVRKWGIPEVDLFASRLNHQLPTYVSWKPDPNSHFIDAIPMSWKRKFVYIFPPFSMLWPVLTKLESDQVCRAIIIIPRWPTQSWYPRILKKSISQVHIRSTDLTLPGTQTIHPMAPKLRLLALLCSWEDQKL